MFVLCLLLFSGEETAQCNLNVQHNELNTLEWQQNLAKTVTLVTAEEQCLKNEYLKRQDTIQRNLKFINQCNIQSSKRVNYIKWYVFTLCPSRVYSISWVCNKKIFFKKKHKWGKKKKPLKAHTLHWQRNNKDTELSSESPNTRMRNKSPHHNRNDSKFNLACG